MVLFHSPRFRQKQYSNCKRPYSSVYGYQVKKVLFIAGFLLILGCGGDEAGYKTIDFSQTQKIPPPERPQNETAALRVAVAAMVSPRETLSIYRELLDFIGREAGRDITLIQRRTYGEINELFPKKEIDMAFICTGPYVLGREVYGFEALATPIIRGEPFYRSYLIVHKDSDFKTLSDLEGRVFAFTDPASNSGALAPTHWLSEMDRAPERFFKDVVYTYSHDNSILAVARGLVDGAAVDGHIWEFYNQQNSFYTALTRVIKKSRPFGSPPLVVSEYLPNKTKALIRDTVLSMHEKPEGAKILNDLMIDRFALPDEAWYAPVRDIYRQTQRNPLAGHETPES